MMPIFVGMAPKCLLPSPAMAAQVPQRRAYLQADDRRQQILTVAARQFAERNYDAVSMEEVAKEAGIARGLLHHYFGAKRELYLEVVRAMLAVPDDLFIPAGGGDEK